jgi:hypothetical protein
MQAEGIAHVSFLSSSRPKAFIPNCQSLNEDTRVCRYRPSIQAFAALGGTSDQDKVKL